MCVGGNDSCWTPPFHITSKAKAHLTHHSFIHSFILHVSPLHCKPAPSWVWDTKVTNPRPIPGVLVTVTLRQEQNPLRPAQVKRRLLKECTRSSKTPSAPQLQEQHALLALSLSLSEAPVLSISQLCQPWGLGFDLRPSSWWSEDGYHSASF